MGKDFGGFLRIVGNKNGRFGGKDHDGVFELAFTGIGTQSIGSEHHEGPGYHRHNQRGKEFLADAVAGLSMERFDAEHGLLVSVVAFNGPAAKIQFDDLSFGEVVFIK